MPKAKPERRVLRFHRLEDLVADAETVLGGPHRTTGGWTAPQIVDHVAALIELSHRGTDARMPLPARLFGRLLKLRLDKPFPAGIRFPKSVERDFAPRPAVTAEQALARLRQAVADARAKGMTKPSPLLGPLTDAQWETVHRRHAELHFSFMHPVGPPQAATS